MQSHVPEEFDRETTGDPSAPNTSSNVTSIGGDVVDAANERERQRQQVEDFRTALREANDTNLTTSERLERLLGVQSQIIPILMEEMVRSDPNEGRSVAASRAVMAIRDMVNMLVKKHETETQDHFNPRSPKMAVTFGWFIELLHAILSKHIDDDVLVSTVFNDLATELGGWEDKVERRLKGVSAKVLPTLTSPFMENFNEKVRGVSTEEPSGDPTAD